MPRYEKRGIGVICCLQVIHWRLSLTCLSNSVHSWIFYHRWKMTAGCLQSSLSKLNNILTAQLFHSPSLALTLASNLLISAWDMSVIRLSNLMSWLMKARPMPGSSLAFKRSAFRIFSCRNENYCRFTIAGFPLDRPAMEGTQKIERELITIHLSTLTLYTYEMTFSSDKIRIFGIIQLMTTFVLTRDGTTALSRSTYELPFIVYNSLVKSFSNL